MKNGSVVLKYNTGLSFEGHYLRALKFLGCLSCLDLLGEKWGNCCTDLRSMIRGWVADTTWGETSDDWVENLAGWEDIVGVLGVTSDLGVEDDEDRADWVGGGGNLEDESWAWVGGSNGLEDDVDEDWVEECGSWDVAEDVEGRDDGFRDVADMEDEIWDWGGDNSWVGDSVDTDWVEECGSWDAGEVTETREV